MLRLSKADLDRWTFRPRTAGRSGRKNRGGRLPHPYSPCPPVDPLAEDGGAGRVCGRGRARRRACVDSRRGRGSVSSVVWREAASRGPSRRARRRLDRASNPLKKIKRGVDLVRRSRSDPIAYTPPFFEPLPMGWWEVPPFSGTCRSGQLGCGGVCRAPGEGAVGPSPPCPGGWSSEWSVASWGVKVHGSARAPVTCLWTGRQRGLPCS